MDHLELADVARFAEELADRGSCTFGAKSGGGQPEGRLHQGFVVARTLCG